MYGSINDFSSWKNSDTEDMESLIGISRQISNLTGLKLTPTGKCKKTEDYVLLKFKVSPKPLKWRGSSGWERVRINIKIQGKTASFVATLDGMPVKIGPISQWMPVRAANNVMKKVYGKLNKQKDEYQENP